MICHDLRKPRRFVGDCCCGLGRELEMVRTVTAVVFVVVVNSYTMRLSVWHISSLIVLLRGGMADEWLVEISASNAVMH